MILPVRLYIDPILHKKCEEITDFSNLEELFKNMWETMNAYKGVGLAANQVGIDKQICILHLENKSKILALANPKVIEYTKEKQVDQEGCLSCPGIYIHVQRPQGVKFEAQTLTGEKIEMSLIGYDARIFFHEYDHLRGTLIADALKRLV